MIDFLKSLCFKAIIDEKIELRKQLSIDDLDVLECKNIQFGHFQFNDAIKIGKKLGIDTYDFSNSIKKHIEHNIKNDEIKLTITGSGFINFKLSPVFIVNNLKKLFNLSKVNLGFNNKVILDYSSPNIAKDMHIGHLRSTVVGDCLSKLLLFSGYKVIKVSHLGDWGTQFGLLIFYLKSIYRDSLSLNKISLSQLSNFYKIAQDKYLNDINFKNFSKNEVVLLQKKDRVSLSFWKVITRISKTEYKKIYSLLNVNIKYKGESFYSDLLIPLIKYLKTKKVISISDGAQCVYLNDLCNLNYPALIVQKSDGGYNYATTELAALYYRIKYYKPKKIIYLTDVGQTLHFNMVFSLVKYLEFDVNNNVELIHIPLGLMLNSDGKKIKTRSGVSEKLIDMLNESIDISKNIIIEKNKNIKTKELNYLSKILGINTIKYSDLSNKLDQNYVFDKKNAFKYTGNTAAFLMYAYVRICGIKKKNKKVSFKDMSSLSNIYISEKAEIDLALFLLTYKHILKLSVIKLNPNIITLYTYKLAEKFHIFFNECTVINSVNSYSRSFLCELSRKILKSCFNILGLKSVDKM
ncbi:MAG TPA: arginine--tRNA ligase [Candidatus Azoamicus sp.]